MKDGRYRAIDSDPGTWKEITLLAGGVRDNKGVVWGATKDWLKWADKEVAEGRLVPVETTL